MKATLAAVVLLACAAAPRAQEFEPARAVQSGGLSAFEFELSGYSYRVAANGNGRRVKGTRARPFNLRLEGKETITRLSFSKFKDDLLLLCEMSDGAGGGGFVARLEQPSMRARWKLAVLSPAAGPTLREDARLYLTGRGFVALLDIERGQYVWHHEDLYGHAGPESFAAFERPVVAGRDVLFRERPVYNGPARTVVVNKKTGAIVRVE
jgi:hypothetical protein